MPHQNYMSNNYFGAMDQSNYFNYLELDKGSVYIPLETPTQGIESGLTSFDLGTTLNPFQNQLQALQAKIREGASKVEFEFAAKGKGNSQATTPETYGKEEREMMRQLAKLNNITSSTHATFQVSGLAGFNAQRGMFSRASQQEAIQEVQRAIDFAKDATTGGAVVVHTGEWVRPVAPYYDEGEKGEYRFRQYYGEENDAPLYVVDEETGQIVQGISRDKKLIVPQWHTAKTWEKEINKKIVGQPRIDAKGVRHPGVITEDDWVDQDGNYIDPRDVDQLFRRVPVYDDKAVSFKTTELNWNTLEEETKKWNERFPNHKLTPEELYARMQIDNQILQFKGQSLFNLQRYEQDFNAWKELKEAYENYKKFAKDLPEDERWKLFVQKRKLSPELYGKLSEFSELENISIEKAFEEAIKKYELSMRHTHESSSSADARASELLQQRNRLVSMEKYGLERTGEALARLAMEAMDKSIQARKIRGPDERWEDLYIAPENVFPQEYGSHPEELLKIVQKGREKFKEELRRHKKITDEKKLDELAQKHIKTTFDIGHLNLWRSMLERKENETEEQFQKRFNAWVKKHLKKLHDAKAIGHIHLADNFGYNDEHLSIGQGNAPVKEFVEMMKEWGYKDFIIEPGSFNAATIMTDAWSYLGAANWTHRRLMSFANQHHAHSGLYAPPTYIVGAYVPSNEWTLWSGVQLE